MTINFHVLDAKDTSHLNEVKQLEKSLFKKSDVWSPVQILGYAFLTFTSVNVHISKIAVRESYRRLGVATGLIREGLKIATSRQRCLTASLHVNPGNTPAMSLYESLGFKLDGQLHDYYGQGKPALKMILDLLDNSSFPI
ncbi:hypothetical protein CEUSTIGMA_g2345.t1 [Chlamydomonas eustigma]|uniref:N-acetyltransferase domain-containing protein n=1 Tax=Chlamydomonas eustigma TaxID=1157962 RepID=A0A250WW16_9CHLO|nr:hypothetical protein CEUSTIGMA_g2345.t1 [Chlamydomonas eustigma]|eukprot:GAX74899.1 hypothetical protein CEUSTIGMA_g2345.t1 [Chlamydomonas eustigma]